MEFLKLLLKQENVFKKPLIDASDAEGLPPLWYALKIDNGVADRNYVFQFASMFVEKGADVDLHESDTGTIFNPSVSPTGKFSVTSFSQLGKKLISKI